MGLFIVLPEEEWVLTTDSKYEWMNAWERCSVIA